MATTDQREVLDLRHFSAVHLRALMQQQARAWAAKLWWDYRNSTDLLLGYFDAHTLPGYVVRQNNEVLGYAFCVYEGHKAIVGDVFANPAAPPAPAGEPGLEALLLRHLLETLQHSPNISRVESQLLLPGYGTLQPPFSAAGFQSYRRLLLEHAFASDGPGAWKSHNQSWRDHFNIRQWKDEDFGHAAGLIHRSYEGHIDSAINDQYRSTYGAQRFLHNIVRFPGCGFFDPTLTRVACDRYTNEMIGMVLCSRVRADVGHITQLCVLPQHRGYGLAHAMLDAVETDLRYHRFAGVTLTVTAANEAAVKLYAARGFRTRHDFEAFVWEK